MLRARMTARFLGGLLAGLLVVAACTNNQPSAAARPTESPAATQPVLVFSRFDPQSGITHLSLASPDGTVLKAIDMGAVGYAVSQDGGAALLLFGSLDPTALNVLYLTPDGTVRHVPDSLLPAFGAGYGGLGANSLDSNPAFADPSTLAGVLNAGGNGQRYVVLDLSRSRMFTLLTRSGQPGPNGWPLYNLLPAGLSGDGQTAWAVLLNPKTSSTASSWRLAEFNLPERKMTSLKTLPLPGELDASDIFSPTVSPDGRILVYQDSPNYSTYAAAVFTTHIVDRRTGRDLIADGAPFVLPGHARLLRFSPDGRLFYVFGEFPVANPIRNRVIAVYDISGRSIWRRDVGDSFYDDITPVGWVDAQHLVFTTLSTTIRGDFSRSVPHSYVVNVLSGSEQELPADLGDPIAVLD